MPTDVDAESGLDILLLGSSTELEILRFKLSPHESVRRVEEVPHTREPWGEVRSHGVAAVVVDLAVPDNDVDSIVLTIFRMRDEYPELVFVFLADQDEFEAKLASMPSEVRTRLRHYRRVSRALSSAEVEGMIDLIDRWQRDIGRSRAPTPRYRYDVALSFAGEERPHAEELATLLKEQGVRVFYDTFETAELWGKNLVDHLFDIYYEQSRYCILMVSSAYATKMWTGHERSAAQQRAIERRDVEYLLPVRIDDTRLPGLPQTVAYLDASIGMPRIASLFLRKLASVMGKGQPAEGSSPGAEC
jgi:hypothetical protein